MKKFYLGSIKIPKRDIFDEERFRIDNPDLYESYLIPPTKKSELKTVIDAIGNMIERGANNLDPQTGRATKTSDFEVQRKYGKVMDILEESENHEGIVEMEDDDFRFMNRKFHQGQAPLIREFNKIILPVSRAIKKADIEEDKPEDKEKKVKRKSK